MASDSGDLSAQDVTNVTFETKRRGYDPAAVNAHLASASATIARLNASIRELDSEVENLTADVEVAKSAALAASQDPLELDEEELAERIGQDAARVLSEARAAAADRLEEAEREAQEIIAGAETVYAARSVEADEQAGRIREKAELDAEAKAQEAHAAAATIISNAEADLEAARTEVYSDRESATAEAHQIIREAELARRQILEDLARRRSAARRQIEQLRAGRERLVASHETVRRALDEISEELAISMSEARAAANTAGHSIADTTIEELEAEIETARLSGLLDTGPVPVVRSPALPSTSSANIKTPTKPAASKVVDAKSSPTSQAPTSEASTSEAQGTEPAPATTDTPRASDNTEKSDKTEASDCATALSSDEDSKTESADSLADVVQLDEARPEVDTKRHPANGRESKKRESKSQDEKSQDQKSEDQKSEASTGGDNDAARPAGSTGLSIAPDPLAEDDDSVGDLFASLREPKPADSKAQSATKKPTGKKKSAGKKKSGSANDKSSKKSAAGAADASTAKVLKKSEPEVDSSELARRLKRVLADEQSRLMSTLKPMEDMPELEVVLGSKSDHYESYWTEVLDNTESSVAKAPEAAAAIDELVEGIRRRVEGAMTGANGDTGAAVVALRNIYREIKTQQISPVADSVCRSSLAKS